ncbi:hypothetical protein CCL10_16260 [Pseudomonas syringae]|nr:hypothetical protein CCL10_16260 [Pseudomonas syringae]
MITGYTGERIDYETLGLPSGPKFSRTQEAESETSPQPSLSGHWTCRSADGCRKPSHSVSRPDGLPSSRLRPVACALRLLFYALGRMTPVQHSMK